MGGPVKRICAIFPVVVVLVALSGATTIIAITPEEVYQDGRRAFTLGHWREAREHFDRFTQTWPDHSLVTDAQLLGSLADLRSRQEIRDQQDADHLASLTARYRALRDKVSVSEIAELAVAVEEPALRQKAASASQLVHLSPGELQHLLNRGLLPAPAADPVGTLSWIHAWRAIHDGRCPAALRGQLDLWRARSLWAVRLSPLAAQANAERLFRLGCWPLEPALDRFVRSAFRQGNPDVKREAALLGISAQELSTRRPGRGRSGRSDYLTYLQERGIHSEEAWCPR